MKELLCQKCGSSISVGMMFCPICGVKPNPVTVEENARAKPSRTWSFKGKWAIVVLVLFIPVAIAIGLLVWPHTDMIGLKGNKRNAKNLINHIQTVKLLNEGRSLAVMLNEADINAYLKFVRIPKADIAFCSVKLMPDLIHVRSGKKIGPYKFYKSEFSPRISVDTWYKVSDNGLVVSKASVGHFPMIGNLKFLAAEKIKNMVLGDPEKYIWLDNISSIEIKKEQIVITVKNEPSINMGNSENENRTE